MTLRPALLCPMAAIPAVIAALSFPYFLLRSQKRNCDWLLFYFYSSLVISKVCRARRWKLFVEALSLWIICDYPDFKLFPFSIENWELVVNSFVVPLVIYLSLILSCDAQTDRRRRPLCSLDEVTSVLITLCCLVWGEFSGSLLEDHTPGEEERWAHSREA